MENDRSPSKFNPDLMKPNLNESNSRAIYFDYNDKQLNPCIKSLDPYLYDYKLKLSPVQALHNLNDIALYFPELSNQIRN